MVVSKNDYLQLIKKHAKLHEGGPQLGLCKLEYHVKPVALTKVGSATSSQGELEKKTANT